MSNEMIIRNKLVVRGDVDILGNQLTNSTPDGNVQIVPNGAGKVKIGPVLFPNADGATGQVLATDGAGNLVWLSGGGGGEINTAASLGTVSDGASLVGDKSGPVLQFRRVKGGDNITVTEGVNDVTVAVTGLATVATSGQWNDLLGKPSFAAVAFSGSIDDLSGAGTAAKLNVGTAAGQIPVLDSNGKLVSSVIPSIAITTVHVVADESARLALQVETGDVAIQTDNNTSYIYDGTAWQVLTVGGSGGVTSVNGQTGVVSLTMADITGVPTTSGYLRWTGTAFSWESLSGGLTDVVQDTSPQLGGNLDVNGFAITSTSDINLTPSAGNAVVIGGAGAAIIESDVNQNLSISANGTGELTLTGTKLLAGTGYTPVDALSLATKEYVDSTVGGQMTMALADSATTDVITVPASSGDVLYIRYVIRRGSAMRAGLLTVITDGTSVSHSDTGPEIGDVGVTIASTISGANIVIQVTTTNTGTLGTFGYRMEKIDI